MSKRTRLQRLARYMRLLVRRDRPEDRFISQDDDFEFYGPDDAPSPLRKVDGTTDLERSKDAGRTD